ncbi:MAG: hypothetical protein E7239_09210 [Sarcina sp.]|nr:hypothetical protein [Sarcina sp.]
MHKNRKRFQALVLAAAIILAAVPGTGFTARAAEPEIPAETAYPLEPEIPAETAYPSEPEIPAETAYPLEAEETAADAVDGIALPAVSLNQEESVFGEIPAEDEIEEDSTNPEDEILPEGDSPDIQEDVSPEPTGGTVSQENPEEDSFPENPEEKGAAENPDQDAASEITEETDPAEIPDQNVVPENPEETDDLEAPDQDVDSENLEETDASNFPGENTSEEPAEGAAQDTETVTQSVDEVREKTDVEHEDNDLLFEEYAEAVFEEAADGAQPGTSGKGQKNTGDQLTGQDRVIYDALKAAALEIADGQRDSAIVEIPLSELGIDAGKQYTAEDLGLDYIYRRVNGTGEWNPAVGDAVNSMLSFDSREIFRRLWADCPYEMYWQRGGYSFPIGLMYSTSASGSGDSWNGFVVFEESPVTFSMCVEQKYRLDQDDEYSVDTSKTGAACSAAWFARSIVNDADNAGLSDYDRLVYYKDRICDEVVYNEEARQNSETYPDRGPWALIYVFDQDPDTNVVCEGYSEAFQYLCGLTEFQSKKIQVYSVSGMFGGGTGAGPHKWNIVHMDDGFNYLADVTNSDEGTVGWDGRLFLKGIEGNVYDGYVLSWEEYQEEVEEEDGTYVYTYPAGSVDYAYDQETRALFTDEELTLSSRDYVVPGSLPPGPPAPAVDEIVSIEEVYLYLTDKIEMRFCAKVEGNIEQDDYITFICAGRTVTQTVSEAETDSEGRLVFSLELAARQMTDQVTFFMTVDGTAGTSGQYSVRSYADTILNGTGMRDLKGLLSAMLNYGSYTQLYAGYRTDSLAAEGLYTDETDPVLNMEGPDLTDFAYTYKLNSKTDGLTIGKASLLLGTDLSLRLYYEPGEGKADKSYSIVLAGGSGLEPVLGYDDTIGMYYADIEHITPTQIGDMFKLDFYAEDGQAADTPAASVTFGPLSYCKGVLESNSSSDELVNLCRALYVYWQTAIRPLT